MRAALVALVLVVVAAIVLWYGNTLNSWVLGGLIGGLAALLLSIPITLLIFSHLSRRHPEPFEDDSEQRVSTTRARNYDFRAEQIEEDEHGIAVSQYRLLAGQRGYDERYADQRLPSQYLPAPHSGRQRYLPPPQGERPSYYPAPGPEWYYDDNPAPLPRSMHHRSAAPARRNYYPESPQRDYPYYPANEAYSQRQLDTSQPYRQATPRPECRGSQHLPATTRRPSRNLVEPQMYARPTGQRPPQPPAYYKPQPTVDGASLRQTQSRRALPPVGQPGHAAQYTSPPPNEPRTEQIGRRSSQTLPYRQLPTSGQFSRRPQADGTRQQPDTSGALRTPLVRRAPYMYEDDPLREELSQHISEPMVRRSSRNLHYGLEED